MGNEFRISAIKVVRAILVGFQFLGEERKPFGRNVVDSVHSGNEDNVFTSRGSTCPGRQRPWHWGASMILWKQLACVATQQTLLSFFHHCIPLIGGEDDATGRPEMVIKVRRDAAETAQAFLGAHHVCFLVVELAFSCNAVPCTASSDCVPRIPAISKVFLLESHR